MMEQRWDGWASMVVIGIFYQAKKKCMVMTYSASEDTVSACARHAFSDKIFKGPIETFSKNLHLIN